MGSLLFRLADAFSTFVIFTGTSLAMYVAGLDPPAFSGRPQRTVKGPEAKSGGGDDDDDDDDDDDGGGDNDTKDILSHKSHRHGTLGFNISWLGLAAVIANLVLTATVVDVVYRGPLLYASHDLSFAQAGFVSDRSAKILIREPNSTTLPVFLSYRVIDGSGDDAWKAAGSVYSLCDDSDYTQALTIDDLKPDTRYQFATSTNHSGSFMTAPELGSVGRRSGAVYSFLTSSCLKPRFPYDPRSHPLAVSGFRDVARLMPALNARFMLFLGDFIYVDVPKRFGTDVESYRRQYRMTYASPDWKPMSRALPWIHVIDDHDIANDWDRNTTGLYANAIDAWNSYHASVNPAPMRAGATYYSFAQGPASFFMMDTRRYRSSEQVRPADSPEKTMLGENQLADLLAWLRQPPPPGVHWKIVVSSVPFTKNWHWNTEDTWGGYLAERKTVLEAMWDAGSGSGSGDDQAVKVVVLSGDRHEFGATKFPPPASAAARWPTDRATVYEFSTSPLNQFYFPKRTYSQDDDEDVPIKYLPDGNSKFGAVEISSPGDGDDDDDDDDDNNNNNVSKGKGKGKGNGSSPSQLKYRLFIDGEEVWSYIITAP
ncbi:MAG: hypothetical protein M1815_001167 [Lichina confinis]|nr:MAG: hypothetical protein M1815_001167 [Lichina confinis]